MNEPASKAPQSKTLYVVQLNFPRGLEAISNRRFDYEHVPDLLSCEGFLGLERFHLTDIEPAGWPRAPRRIEYMNLWQLEGPEVLASEAYRLRSNGPDPSWQGRTNQHRYHALRERQRKMEGRLARASTQDGRPARACAASRTAPRLGPTTDALAAPARSGHAATTIAVCRVLRRRARARR
jgi:hypothetical protein